MLWEQLNLALVQQHPQQMSQNLFGHLEVSVLRLLSQMLVLVEEELQKVESDDK